MNLKTPASFQPVRKIVVVADTAEKFGVWRLVPPKRVPTETGTTQRQNFRRGIRFSPTRDNSFTCFERVEHLSSKTDQSPSFVRRTVDLMSAILATTKEVKDRPTLPTALTDNEGLAKSCIRFSRRIPRSISGWKSSRRKVHRTQKLEYDGIREIHLLRKNRSNFKCGQNF